MKVALLHNVRPPETAAALPDDAFEEYDSPATIAALVAALQPLGIDVEPVVADARLPWRLSDGGFDFAFNYAEGSGRRCREAVPAAVCELLGIPFTGSDALTLAVTLDKSIAKRIVSPDVPVARGVLLDTAADEDGLGDLRYPAIVKPNDEGSSKGIREDPVCGDATAAARRARWLRERYGCPVLVEEFLTGAEVTVAIAGNHPDVRVLGTMEIAPIADANGPFVYSIEVKRDWTRHVEYHVPPRLSAAAEHSVREYAVMAHRLLGCRDLARLDFRFDADGVPRFLECNPIPGLGPITSDIVMMTKHRLPYEDLIQDVLRDAMRRVGIPLR